MGAGEERVQTRLEEWYDYLMGIKNDFANDLETYLNKFLVHKHSVFKSLDDYIVGQFKDNGYMYWNEFLPHTIEIKIDIQDFIADSQDGEIYDTEDEFIEIAMDRLEGCQTLYNLYDMVYDFDAFDLKDIINFEEGFLILTLSFIPVDGD